MSLSNLNIDRSWTLFLDRDGVINRRLPGDYVKKPEDFELLPGVGEAMKLLREIFGLIIVVSNQQGIGKGLMNDDDLKHVNNAMLQRIEDCGGSLDAVFYAPMLAKEKHIMRKPRIGMGLAARKKFPEIRFKKSIMVGDTSSDMRFGKCLGMKTVLVGNDTYIARGFPKLVDYYFEDLRSFTAGLHKRSKTITTQ